jgi:FkbM family methyltransferase
VLDVGANAGQFARYVTALLPQARVFCFEPLPGPFEQLRNWADSHGMNGSRVIAINTALGDSEGEIEIFHHVEHTPSSSLLRSTSLTAGLYPQTRKQRSEIVSLRSLDKLVEDSSIQLVPDILIKMDVQGYEDRVLRGGAKVFASARACLLEINLDLLYEQQASFKELVLLLDGHGLRYRGNFHQTYGRDGHVIFVDAVFTRE